MTETPAGKAFEAFQARVTRTAACAGVVVAGCAVVVGRSFGGMATGLVLGFAASLASHAIKVRTLRRFSDRSVSARRGRATLAVLVRLALYAVALGIASLVPWIDFWATVVGLFLTNAVTVVLALQDARRPQHQT